MTLMVHPQTSQLIDVLSRSLPQSILLTGPKGVGLLAVAQAIAGKDVHTIIRPQDNKEAIDSDNGTISVDIIRRLYSQTRGKQSKRQVVIIDNADRMLGPSQSAFLKLLEEPNSHIHFLLTSHQPQLLKSTILSRVQQSAIRHITAEQTTQLISELGVTDTTKVAQLQYIAGGLAAEITRLVADDAYFERRAAVMSDARSLLGRDTYQNLVMIQKYQANREQSIQLIDSALQIARRSLSAKPQHGLVTQLEQLVIIKDNLLRNYSVKLQLAQFVL